MSKLKKKLRTVGIAEEVAVKTAKAARIYWQEGNIIHLGK